ncbi:MAG: type II secretion system F family protein [Candidatus Altiarchaeota archaeon]
MVSKRIPFIGNPRIRKISRIFLWMGDVLSKTSPYMELLLKQSGVAEEYQINARGYLSVAFFMSLVVFIAFSSAIIAVFHAAGNPNYVIGPLIGAVVGVVMYLYITYFPKQIVNSRVKYIERNLLFALRSILIQIRSGVPVFDTLVALANGDYGPISKEMHIVVEKVNAGKDVVASLEELAIRNPSMYFRRALWQMVNSMKSGSDVGDNLSEVISSLSKEQLVEVRKYKSVLNPLAMMYMMVAVIMPSLGITMLIVLSSFPGMEEIGSERTFWILLSAIIVMQVIFIGIIRSRRPNLIGA